MWYNSAMRPRHGFIILFGSRSMVGNDSSAQPLQATCPSCQQNAMLIPKAWRSWFTLFFIPIFPISGRTRFTECSACKAQFKGTVEEFQQALAADYSRANQEAITLYNSLRASPNNSVALNQLMETYASIKEYGQAISSAAMFPDALNSSEQCLTTLGRVHLIQQNHAAAIESLAAAIERNPQFAPAHFLKAVAHLTSTPPDLNTALAHARQARTFGHPDAEPLVRDIESRQRQGPPPLSR
jgi:tetratricopeptide (TPR) repeat protein